jgi:hypothetical protein
MTMSEKTQDPGEPLRKASVRIELLDGGGLVGLAIEIDDKKFGLALNADAADDTAERLRRAAQVSRIAIATGRIQGERPVSVGDSGTPGDAAGDAGAAEAAPN